jgi:outer membrane protein OmpA-like peptidoglycan-associated protein
LRRCALHHAAEQQLQPDGEHPGLRRANAVKDALVRNGVTATVISVIGKGETQPHGGNNRGITATVRPNGATKLSTDRRIRKDRRLALRWSEPCIFGAFST